MALPAAMLAAGGLAGGIAGMAKKTAGTDAGNALQLSGEDQSLAQGQLGNLLRYQDNPDVVDPLKGSQTATREVQNNGILGDVFGKGGTMGRTAAEEQNLASRGYSLKPEDYEAYGQGSDQIAREFGAQEGGLAQALAGRGLSSSSMAGQSFSGVQGNKMERLGQLQRQIANDRMKTNMERLGQTRSFLANLTGQGENAINSQFNRQMTGRNAQVGLLEDKNKAAQSRLESEQNQANEQLGQRQQTSEMPGWAKGLTGALSGASSLGSAMNGAGAFSSTPKFNTTTGAAMYDPQTGKQYTGK